ncbi:MAG: hypothetical protein V7603_3511 [Micromonosporaceae bacterium]
MLETSARLLRLLSLLQQARPRWKGCAHWDTRARADSKGRVLRVAGAGVAETSHFRTTGQGSASRPEYSTGQSSR